MPELPEVEVTRLGIEPDLVGRQVRSVALRVPALRYPLPTDLQARLAGRLLRGVTRRGKYLLFDFGEGHLLVHLGMSGSLRLLDETAARQPGKHDHVDIAFDVAGHSGRSKSMVLRLRDPRRFGAVLWLGGDPMQHPLLADLGIEPLEPGFTTAWLKAAFADLRTPVKLALMDAHRIVGIGNIYASESLFRAGIDPRRPAGRIATARLARLVDAVRETLTEAIAAGGSSLRDFIRSDGSSGYFQQRYFVYGRTGETCRNCGSLVREIRQGQRATFFCPKCQR